MSDNRKQGQVPGSKTKPPVRSEHKGTPSKNIRRDLNWQKPVQPSTQQTRPPRGPASDPASGMAPATKRMLIFLAIFLGLVTIAAAYAPFSIFDSPVMLVSLLGSLVLGAVYSRNLQISGRGFVKNVAIWGLLISGLSGFYYIAGAPDVGPTRSFNPASVAQPVLTGEGDLVVQKQRDGHFWLNVRLNGADIPMMVDTGASEMVLARADAEAAGIDTAALNYSGVSITANGDAKFATARVDSLQIGPLSVSDMPAAVMESATGLKTSLFGMRGLQMFASFEFRGNELYLRR